MGFGIFCLGTIILSYIMSVANELRLYKDLADAGYKFNNKRYKEVSENLSTKEEVKTNLLFLLIPFYNILMVYKKTMDYNKIRPMLIDQFNTLGIIEEMNDFEKKEYAKRPTGFNAVFVPLKVENKLANSSFIKINKGEITGTVIYKYEKKMKGSTIIDSAGDIAKLPEEEQKKYVINAIFNAYEANIKRYGASGFKKNFTIEYNNSNFFF